MASSDNMGSIKAPDQMNRSQTNLAPAPGGVQKKEEHIRPKFSGDQFRFSHPLSYFSRLIGRRRVAEDRHELQKKKEEKHIAAKQENKTSKKETRGGISPKFLAMEGSENSFEAKVKKVVEGEESMPQVSEGKSAKFSSKTEVGWKQFFKNMLKMGNAEVMLTKNEESFLKGLFRGLYRNSGQKGMTLVGDFQFLEKGRVATDKFSQMPVEKEEVLHLLEKMDPGENLDKKTLLQSGEDKIAYTKLAHQVEEKSQSSDALMQQLKSPISAGAMARMETSLVTERNRRSSAENEKANRSMRHEDELDRDGRQNNSWFYFHGTPLERLRFSGKPRFWMILGYGIAAAILVLITFLIIKGT